MRKARWSSSSTASAASASRALVEAFTAEARGRGAVVLAPRLRHDRAHAARLPRGAVERDRRRPETAEDAAAGSRASAIGSSSSSIATRSCGRSTSGSSRPSSRALSDNTRVVLAGREAPMAGWSIGDGSPVPEPAAGQPAARRRRGSCSDRTASTATTSSASTGSPAAIRCRCASPRRRSWPARSSTTRRRPSPRSSRS